MIESGHLFFGEEKVSKRTLTGEYGFAVLTSIIPKLFFFSVPFFLFTEKKKRNTTHSLSIIRTYPVPCRTHRDTRESVAEEISTESMTCR